MKLGKSSNTVIQKLSEYDFAHGWPTRLQTLKMAFSRGASIGVCRRPEMSPLSNCGLPMIGVLWDNSGKIVGE